MPLVVQLTRTGLTVAGSRMSSLLEDFMDRRILVRIFTQSELGQLCLDQYIPALSHKHKEMDRVQDVANLEPESETKGVIHWPEIKAHIVKVTT